MLLQMKIKLLLLICFFSFWVSCSNESPVNNEPSLEKVIGQYFNARFDIVCGSQEQYWNNYDKETEMFSDMKKIIKFFSKEKRMKFYVMTFSFDQFLDTEPLGEWGNVIVCNGDLDVLKQHVRNLVLKSGENSNSPLIERYQEMLLFLNTIKECDIEN